MFVLIKVEFRFYKTKDMLEKTILSKECRCSLTSIGPMLIKLHQKRSLSMISELQYVTLCNVILAYNRPNYSQRKIGSSYGRTKVHKVTMKRHCTFSPGYLRAKVQAGCIHERS